MTKYVHVAFLRLSHSHVEVSENGSTHKSSKLDHDLVLKPMVLLILHFKNPPHVFSDSKKIPDAKGNTYTMTINGRWD